MENVAPKFSTAALENINETNADWALDLHRLRSGAVTRERLLDNCLDGADADRVQGWREYVAALVDAALADGETSVTDTQITALSNEAAEHGDLT